MPRNPFRCDECHGDATDWLLDARGVAWTVREIERGLCAYCRRHPGHGIKAGPYPTKAETKRWR